MLDALRKSTSGWIAKILLFLLMFSFAIWGIGDMLVGYGRGAIATVGNEAISVEEFQRAEQNALANVSQEAGRRISSEEARLRGLPRQVLRGVIGQTALKEQAKNLGLDLSTEDVVTIIKEDETFEGPDGKFSKLYFDSFLNQNGLSEAGYVSIRRDDELRQQITSALQSSVAVPPALIEAEHAFRNEERTVKYVKIDENKIKVPEPDEAKLKDYYETNKTSFMTPQYRKFDAIALSLDDIKKSLTIAEADLKQAYEDTKSQYDKPEKRRIQQIVFQTKEAAETALKEIPNKGFLQVAADMGLKEEDVSLGLVGKSQIFDQKVADAAFGLNRDALSGVIDGKFGPVVLRVIEIQDGEESSFEKAKDKVDDLLKTERARLEIQERYDLVEEARNAGKTLKEIAEEQKLSFFHSDAADQTNKTRDGKTAIDQPDSAEILTAIFSSDPGYEHDAVELTKSEGYAWYNTLDVIKPEQKTLDAVKDEVKSVFVEKETARLIKEFADKLIERLNTGEDFDAVAKDAGNKPEITDPPITRIIEPQGLTKEAVEVAFSLAEGTAGSADSFDRKSRTVFQVTKITPAEKITDKDREAISLELAKVLREDYLTTYVEALQNRIGVDINQAEFDRVTGQVQE